MAGAVPGIHEVGRQPTGAHRCILRFAPWRLPPVDAEWSLAMQDDPDGLPAPVAVPPALPLLAGLYWEDHHSGVYQMGEV
jgi:hypothetical protein